MFRLHFIAKKLKRNKIENKLHATDQISNFAKAYKSNVLQQYFTHQI